MTWPAATVGCASGIGRLVPAQRRRGAAQRGLRRPPARRAVACAGSPRPCWPRRTPPTGCSTLLRDAGYAPVPEDATGAVVLTRPTSRPGTGPPGAARRPVDDFDPPRLHGPRLAGVVEQIRLGDRLARAARRSPLIRAAGRRRRHTDDLVPGARAGTGRAAAGDARAGAGVGRLRRRARQHRGAKLVRPVSMGAGYLRAEDDRNEMLHTFALHRITSATLEDD